MGNKIVIELNEEGKIYLEQASSNVFIMEATFDETQRTLVLGFMQSGHCDGLEVVNGCDSFLATQHYFWDHLSTNEILIDWVDWVLIRKKMSHCARPNIREIIQQGNFN